MKDILLNNNNDLQAVGHDLVTGDADTQIAATIMEAATGEFKEAPLLGADMRRMLGGTPDPFWRGRVKAMLKQEHINVSDIEIDDENINIVMQ